MFLSPKSQSDRIFSTPIDNCLQTKNFQEDTEFSLGDNANDLNDIESKMDNFLRECGDDLDSSFSTTGNSPTNKEEDGVMCFSIKNALSVEGNETLADIDKEKRSLVEKLLYGKRREYKPYKTQSYTSSPKSGFLNEKGICRKSSFAPKKISSIFKVIPGEEPLRGSLRSDGDSLYGFYN